MDTKISKRLDELEITEKRNDAEYHEKTEKDNEKKGIIYKRLVNVFSENEENSITEKQFDRKKTEDYDILEKRLNDFHTKDKYNSNKQPLCEEYEKLNNLNANILINKIILANKNIIDNLNIEINKGERSKKGIISGEINSNRLAKYGIYSSDSLSNKINSSINNFKQILANIVLDNTDDFKKIKFDNIVIMPKIRGILKFKASFR